MNACQAMTLGRAALLLGAVGLGAVTGVAEARTPGPRIKTATSPKEAVAFFVEANRKGDVDGILNQLDKTPREYFRLVLAPDRAFNAWHAAADEKFGKKARKGGPLRIESIEVLSEKREGDKALLKCKETWPRLRGKGSDTRERFYLAVKVAGAWKLVPPEGAGARPADADPKKWQGALEKVNTKGIKAEVARIDAQTRTVKAGKFKTREEAAVWLGGLHQHRALRAFVDCVGLAVEVEKYRIDHGDPTSLQELVKAAAIPPDKLIDPWGKPFQLDLSGPIARVFTTGPLGDLIESRSAR
jgi:hypothetical protein